MKYLIEIHHGIGDVVQMTGVIDSILNVDKSAYIALIINKDSYKSLFENDDRVKKFYRIDFKEMSLLEILNEVYLIRQECYDYYLISPISNVKATRVLTKMIGAKVSSGEQLRNNGKSQIRVAYEDVHIVKRNNNVFKSLGLGDNCCNPRLIIDSNQFNDIDNNTVALCVGTSIPQKTWPIRCYLDVATWFLDKGYNVVILGGKKEKDIFDSIEIDNRIKNYAGQLSLIQSATVTSKAGIVLGGDTGVMHMASAVGATTLTLFGCTDPRLHSPYSMRSYFYNIDLPCQFCYEHMLVDKCNDYKCINKIEVDEVIKIMTEILESNEASGYKYIIS